MRTILTALSLTVISGAEWKINALQGHLVWISTAA
jgi:hypothetical protein